MYEYDEVSDNSVVRQGSIQYVRRHDPSGVLYSLGSGTYSRTLPLSRRRAGNDNDNYRSRMAAGEVVISPYHTSGSRLLNDIPLSGDANFYGGPNYTDIVSYNNIFPLDYATIQTPDYDLDLHRSLAITAAESQMLVSAAQTAVTLAEAKKTLGLVSSGVRNVLGALSSARRSLKNGTGIEDLKGLLKGDAPSLDEAMSMWMDWRYGYRPLIHDIHGHQEALAEYLTRDESLRRERANSQPSYGVEIQSNVKLSTVSGASTPPLDVYGNTYIHPNVVRSSAGFYYRVLPDNINSLIAYTGMSSPLGTVWELIPFSFVADWFTNSGDFWNTVGAYRGHLKDVLGYSNKIEKLTLTLEALSCTNRRGQFQFTGTLPVQQVESFAFTRDLALPGDGGLHIDVNLDVSKLIDSFAIARGLSRSNLDYARARI